MFRSTLRFALLCLLAVSLSSCSLLYARWKKRTKLDPRPTRVGEIALVNPDERFVLIEATMSDVPPMGTVLRAYHGDTVSAELRTTGVRRRPFLVADLVSGAPSKGDLIMQPLAGEPPAPKATAPETKPPEKRPLWKRLLNPFGRH